MTKTDQEALQELGRDIGQSVFPAILDGRLAVSIGNLTTADSDRAYMALRSIEQEGR
jgi:hypothetical protein